MSYSGGRRPRRIIDARLRLGSLRLVALSLFLVVPLAAPPGRPGEPQAPATTWSAPQQISSYEHLYNDRTHTMTTDPYGYVHAFWVETLANGSFILQYARFDGRSWSYPLDIFRSLSNIDRIAAAVDGQGTLHLMWTQGDVSRQNPVRHAYAPAHNALSARHWSTPVQIIGLAHLLALRADSRGTLHLIYTEFYGYRAGLHYMRSEDQGQTWSRPVWIDPDIPPDYGPASLQFVIDESDILHASWYYTLLEDNGGDWVRYARSADGGTNWSPPFTVDRDYDNTGKLRMSGPVLAAGGGMAHIVWATNILRSHRYSADGGQTWSASARILGSLEGQAGDSMVSDEAGRTHFLSQIRFPQGVYHATWSEQRWNAPALIYLIRQNSTEIIDQQIHAHDLVAVVRGGRQLVVLFFDSAQERPPALYAMHTVVEDPAALSLAPTPEPTPTATPKVTPSPTAVAPPTAAALFETEADAQGPVLPNSPGLPVTVSAAAALLFCFALGIFRLARRR